MRKESDHAFAKLSIEVSLKLEANYFRNKSKINV